MDRQTQYFQDVNSSLLDLQIDSQSKSQQVIFADTGKLILAFICGDKRPRTANTIEGEQSWRSDTIWLQDLV